MAKTMKSFRISDEGMDYLVTGAAALGISETAFLEMALEWAVESQFVGSIQYKKLSQGKEITPRRAMNAIKADNEVANSIRAKIWQA